VIDMLRKYLTDQKVPFTEKDIQQNMAWLKWEIKREVFTTIFGLNEGYKVALENDPQLDKAVESIPESRVLYSNARKILAERDAGPSTTTQP
jgi:carboxyl-terminal processing protease